MSPRQKLLFLLFAIALPGLLAATTATLSFSRAQQVSFCGSCHVMTPWIEDMTGEKSDSLVADHYRNRWIQHEQCYVCHSNYGFLGPLEAKIKGVRHVVAFYIGENDHIELYDEMPNENCLQCHAQAKGFLEESTHEPIEDLLSGKDRCVECHENLHEVDVDEDEDESEGASASAGKNDEQDEQDGQEEKGDGDESPASAPAKEKE